MPWSHIILEGYCMYDHLSEKIHKYCKMYKNGKVSKKPTTIEKNKNYISKSKRPKWCKSKNKKLVPQFRCLCNGKNDKKCLFFAFCNANRLDYNAFYKAIFK